jgi:hypothetical protein
LIAIAYPEPGHKSRPNSKIESEVHKGELSRARAICKWAGDGLAFFTAKPRLERRQLRAEIGYIAVDVLEHLGQDPALVAGKAGR